MTIKWNHNSLLKLASAGDELHRHPTIAGLGLRVRLDKLTWVWRRSRHGKVYKTKLGKFPAFRISDAEEWATELNTKLECEGNPLEIPEPAPARLTVAEAWDDYIEDRTRAGKRTVGELDQMGKLDIVALIGNQHLGDVTVNDIQRIVKRPIERGIGCTKGRVRSNCLLRVTRTFFRWCIRRRLDGLLWNPAGALDFIDDSEGRKEKRILSVREMALLILASREIDRQSPTPSYWTEVMTIAVMNGNRKTEIIEACREEWDHRERVWRLPASRYKTKRGHPLPVGPASAAAFERLVKVTQPTPFLIPSSRGIRTGNDRYALEKLRSVMEEIGGAPVPRWTMHAIRYGFRSHIRKSKIADSELAERLIHPKAKAAMDQYYDPDYFAEMREALTAWDKLIQDEIAQIVGQRMRLTA